MLLALLLACTGPAADTAADDTAAAGSGTIGGSFDRRPFDTVGASWRIGRPDDPEQTMVVYVFDAPIVCNDIASAGWDAVVADTTQVIEMKVVGLAAGDYPQAERTPADGESENNYTLTSTSGTPAETGAASGDIVIDSAEAAAATGSFDLTFPSGDNLTGTFEAAPCAQGQEP